MKAPNKTTILGILLIVIFGLLIYGEYKFSTMVIESKQKLDSLKKTSLLLERTVEQKTKQISVYKKAIAELEKYQLDIPEDEVDFYDKVQQQLTNNAVRSNQIRGSKGQKGRNSVTIDFEGPYYAILQTLSDWRNMDVVVRVSSLSLGSLQENLARGNITIESVLKGGGE